MSKSEDQLQISAPIMSAYPLPPPTNNTLNPDAKHPPNNESSTEDVCVSQGTNPPPYLPPPLGTHPVPLDSEVQQSKETDIEGLPVVKEFVFDNPSIRRGFLRKVYAILSVQLAITLSFICWFLFDKTTMKFVQDKPIILIVSFLVVIVSLIFLAFCGDVRRRAPMNYIILILFTLAESVMLGAISSLFESDTVALAVGVTAIVCFGLTLFAFQTKYDFTICGALLFILLLLLIVFGFAISLIPTTTSRLLYAFLGALLFSVYLVYDTQIMLGGEHKYTISPEEYIFAAINLYVDIINIFLRILIILGGGGES